MKQSAFVRRLQKAFFLLIETPYPRPSSDLSTFLRPQGKTFFGLLLSASIILRVTLTILFLPIGLLLRICHIKILHLNVKQIGNVIWLDCFLREISDLSRRSRYIILSSGLMEANPYLINLYRSRVIILRNPIFHILLFPFTLNPFCTDWLRRFDASGSHLAIRKAFLKHPLPIVSLDDGDLVSSRLALESIGLPSDSRFVCLHVRDSAYYKNPRQNTRNGNLDDYLDAIKLLIQRDLHVVLIGHPTAAALSDSGKLGRLFVDYAHSSVVSPLNDIYLMSECEFLLGTDSGPAFVSPLFGRNTVMTNAFPPLRSVWFLPGDITTPKRVSTMDNKKITPNILFSDDLIGINSLKQYHERGFATIDSSPREIYEAVLQLLDCRPPSYSSLYLSRLFPPLTRNSCNLGMLSNFYSDKLFQD